MSKIPNQKHSKDELSRLRAQSAMQANNSPIVETYNKKLANKFVIVLGYLLPLVAPFWAIAKSMKSDSFYSMNDFYIMLVPILLGLAIAGWIALKRVLSRHNSAFILILSLFCAFPIISAVNSHKELKYDLMTKIGKDVPMEDPLLEDESLDDAEVGNNADTMTDEDRAALFEAEEEVRRAQREWLREKAEREAAVKALEATEGTVEP